MSRTELCVCVFYWEAHCGPFQDMLEVAVAGWGAAARSIPHMSSLRASRRACVPAPEINFLGHVAAASSSSPPFDVSDMHVPSRGGLSVNDGCTRRTRRGSQVSARMRGAAEAWRLETDSRLVRGNLERSAQLQPCLPRGEAESAARRVQYAALIPRRVIAGNMASPVEASRCY